MSLPRRHGLAILGGALVALSLPPWGWWPLTFVGVACYHVAAGDAGLRRRQLAALGGTFALPWMILGMLWMWQLTVPGYLAAAVIFAGAHAGAAALAPSGRWGVVGRPLVHTLVEALRFSFPFGGVPLASLAIALTGGPFLAIAAVGGAIALTWFAFQVGALLGAAATGAAGRDETPRPPRAAALPVAAAALAAALAVAGFVAPRGRDDGRRLAVAAVQGGGEQGTSALEVPSRLVTERLLAATATIPAPTPEQPLDLVIWPENGIDVFDFATSTEHAEVTAEAARLGVPLTVGITEEVPGQPDRFTNAQVVVVPTGEIVSRYDKVRRVPFGEYVPLRGVLEAFGAPIERIGRDALAGTMPALLTVPAADGDVGIAVAISWEIFFGGRVNEGVEAGAGFVINPTNGASYTGTIVQTQQVASSRLRAVESGRWVVQVAPTGFSAVIGPDGTVHQRTAISERAVLRADIPLRTGRTPYSRLGDAPIIATLLVAVAAVTVRSRRPPPRVQWGQTPMDAGGEG